MRRFFISLIIVAGGVLVAMLLNQRRERPPVDPSSSRQEKSSRAPNGPLTPRPAASPDAGVGNPPLGPNEPLHFDLGELDFTALRAETPNSLYWLMAAPTDDPAVLEARAQTRKARNEQYGKVVSNTATVEEIHDYYAYRRKLSEDYIEVVQLILDEHGDDLSERDTGLFELAISMHTARLAEIPSKLADALARKEEYDRVKDEWQKQQREKP